MGKKSNDTTGIEYQQWKVGTPLAIIRALEKQGAIAITTTVDGLEKTKMTFQSTQ